MGQRIARLKYGRKVITNEEKRIANCGQNRLAMFDKESKVKITLINKHKTMRTKYYYYTSH